MQATQDRTKRIYDALCLGDWKEYGNARALYLNMKSGNRVRVVDVYRARTGAMFLEVTSTGFNGKKYFKSLETLAKAMACGIIK